ncbi:MAG: hypothetical protein Q9219_005687 [cf. Caloplaca sp. 3 TL-2023]
MPICIECRYPVSRLYHVLHSGNTGARKPPPINRSTKPALPNAAKKDHPPARGKPKPAAAVPGGDVRLTQCPRCKRFADKYVEHDYVVLFIDLVLVKPQPSITRLGTLLLLFDVYLTWSRIESLLPHVTASSRIPHLPILLQYSFYLLLCATTTAAQHVTIRWLAQITGLGARIKREAEENQFDGDEFEGLMAQYGGAADSYYNNAGGGPPPMQYQQNQQTSYPPTNYAQNYQNNAPPPAPMNGGEGKQTFEQAFKLDRPKYNDLWAGILLILTFLGFVAVSGLSLQGYSANKAFSGGGIYHAPNDFSLNTNTIVLFAFILACAFAFSWAYFTAARAFTKQFIWITGILHIVFGIGTCIYYFYRHYYSAAIIFAIFSIFSIICFISWIPRIPFSVVMLQQTMDVAKSFGHVFLVSAIGGIVSVAFGAWFSVTLVAIYVKYEPNSGSSNPACSSGSGGTCSSAKVIGLIVFVTFAGYWITEWLKNTIHSVIAGVYGSWFFMAGKPGGMPSGATRGAFRRSMTYSFGSISFGSLVVALINMVRQAVSIAQQQEAQEGNIVATIAFCCLGCIIGLLDWAVQFINRYAFSHIALYGKAYIPAAKDTWTMMKNRGIDALVNDCLIGPVLTMGSTFVAYLCCLLAFLYLEFTDPAYNQGGTFTPVVMAFAFLIGLQVCQIFMTPIGSGVDTIFVAAAWDPEVLMRDHPDFWARMVQVYPKVQTMIHA